MRSAVSVWARKMRRFKGISLNLRGYEQASQSNQQDQG